MNMTKKIRLWWAARMLLKVKRRALFEMTMDLYWLDNAKSDYLDTDLSEERIEMAELKDKDELTPEEELRIAEIEKKIKKSFTYQKVKSDTNETIADLREYIDMMKTKPWRLW